MTYLLDTNIIIHGVRNSLLFQNIVTEYDLFNTSVTSLTSFACIAEARAIAARNGWGINKLNVLQGLERIVQPIWVNNYDFVERYVEIDTFSAGKHPTEMLTGSARKMGKNDLWIAATASLLDASLITTDADFDHLNDVFLNVIKIEI